MDENNDKKYIDLDEALTRVRGNKTIYRKMLGLFLQSKELDALEESLGRQDYPQAADLAHAIKGMTGNLSLTALFEASTKLMQELREGTPREESLREYREALKETRDQVEALCARMDGEA